MSDLTFSQRRSITELFLHPERECERLEIGTSVEDRDHWSMRAVVQRLERIWRHPVVEDPRVIDLLHPGSVVLDDDGTVWRGPALRGVAGEWEPAEYRKPPGRPTMPVRVLYQANPGEWQHLGIAAQESARASESEGV